MPADAPVPAKIDPDEIRDLVRTFVQREVPEAEKRRHDREREFPHKYWPLMASLGFMQMCVPVAYGGTNGDVRSQTVLIEELARQWFPLAEALATSVFAGVRTLQWHGTEQQRQEFLPKFADGSVRFSFGVTEPGGGTDVLGAMRTRARKTGDGYIINGSKMYTTMADVSDYIVVLTRTEDLPKRSEGLTLLLVPTDAPGLSIQRVNTLGLRSTATNQCFFDDVRVPRDFRIGDQGKGWDALLASLNNERIAVAALALGNAQAALDLALDYAKQREAFGRKLGQIQAIQHYLARMSIEIETARLALYHAAELQDQGKDCGREATMAKYVASEAGVHVTDLGMRILAGAGYTEDFPMERFFRDARVFTFGPITNEMVLNFVAGKLGLPRSF
jgi:acyl-CoA dehydrogenase